MRQTILCSDCGEPVTVDPNPRGDGDGTPQEHADDCPYRAAMIRRGRWYESTADEQTRLPTT